MLSITGAEGANADSENVGEYPVPALVTSFPARGLPQSGSKGLSQPVPPC